MNIVINLEHCIFSENNLEEILKLLENNGYVIEEETDRVYIRKEKS